MESFFLSETLKYFYLIFQKAQKDLYAEAYRLGNLLEEEISPVGEVVDPDDFVLTTEGHFIPLVKPNFKFTMGIKKPKRKQDHPV